VALPTWITKEVIEDVVRTMGRHYGGAFTTEDAIEMLLRFGGIFEVLEGKKPCRTT
jgi:hypothetical protein